MTGARGDAGSPALRGRACGPWLVVAAWAAVVAGLLEGAVLAIARLDPRILAPNKVSNAVIAIAPLVNLPAFLLLAVAGCLTWGVVPPSWRRMSDVGLAVRGFVFVGVVTILGTPQVVHALAVVLLATGVAVAVGRAVHERESRLVAWLWPRTWLLAAAVGFAALGVAGTSALAERLAAGRLGPAGPAPDVIVLLLDTVRRDRLTAERAPFLHGLAARGITFTNAWATSSWSLPSHASVLTGEYAPVHGGRFPSIAIADSVPMLSEYLARRGYATGAFSSNANWVTPEHVGRGFLRFEAYRPIDIAQRTVVGRIVRAVLDRAGHHHAGRGKPAAELSGEFVRFLDAYPDRPVFAYLCFMDVNREMHRRALRRLPWEPRPTPAEVIAAYDSAITALDAELEMLFGVLEQRGRLANTVILVTSDHGESFGRGALGDHEPRGHSSSLYPEQVRVPLFAVVPGEPPRVATEAVSIRSIPATVAAVLGDTSSPFGAPSLLDAGDDSTTAILATLDYASRYERAVMWGQWQYIVRRNALATEELFDLHADPLASRNLAPQADTVLQTARSLLRTLEPGRAAPKQKAASR